MCVVVGGREVKDSILFFIHPPMICTYIHVCMYLCRYVGTTTYVHTTCRGDPLCIARTYIYICIYILCTYIHIIRSETLLLFVDTYQGSKQPSRVLVNRNKKFPMNLEPELCKNRTKAQTKFKGSMHLMWDHR